MKVTQIKPQIISLEGTVNLYLVQNFKPAMFDIFKAVTGFHTKNCLVRNYFLIFLVTNRDRLLKTLRDILEKGMLLDCRDAEARGRAAPRFCQNRRRRQAAAVRCITICPPRLSDLAPSLQTIPQQFKKRCQIPCTYIAVQKCHFLSTIWGSNDHQNILKIKIQTFTKLSLLKTVNPQHLWGSVMALLKHYLGI